MIREIQTTADGSTTIFLPEMKEGYHSKFGAIQESQHVFIKNGLELFQNRNVAILEIGLGTGLNALTTFLFQKNSNFSTQYIGVEAYPVAFEEAMQMNYCTQLKYESAFGFYQDIHNMIWERQIEVRPNFYLTKVQMFFEDITFSNQFNLIYFDAFGYEAQPHLWSPEIFAKMHKALCKNGVLVTYACRTIIKNTLLNLGFNVEKLPGAPGKREMLRATKA